MYRRHDDRPTPAGGPSTYRDALQRFERDYLAALLRQAEGDVARAAELAGLHRVHLYRLVRRHALNLADFRPGRAVACGLPGGRPAATSLAALA